MCGVPDYRRTVFQSIHSAITSNGPCQIPGLTQKNYAVLPNQRKTTTNHKPNTALRQLLPTVYLFTSGGKRCRQRSWCARARGRDAWAGGCLALRAWARLRLARVIEGKMPALPARTPWCTWAHGRPAWEGGRPALHAWEGVGHQLDTLTDDPSRPPRLGGRASRPPRLGGRASRPRGAPSRARCPWERGRLALRAWARLRLARVVRLGARAGMFP